MHPMVCRFNWMGKDVVIGSYGLIMLLAFAAGGAVALYLARARGYRPGYFINHCALMGAAAMGGALLAGFVMFLPQRAGQAFAGHPAALVSWGGIMGGMAAMAFMAIKWKEDFIGLGDIFAPASLLSIGIGRIGCFLAGCCYGVRSTSFITVDFSGTGSPASTMPQPLVPVQLISASLLIAAAALIIPPAARKMKRGFPLGAAVITYSLSRFIIEFWRDDPRLFLLGLSDGQWFS
ncbi:MAG: hypothetical protein E4G96_10080, partial [Chrysiogenales bacterium]